MSNKVKNKLLNQISIFQWPSVVSIQGFRKTNIDLQGKFHQYDLLCEVIFCSGTIIHIKLVLTSAHCFIKRTHQPDPLPGFLKNQIYVHAGSIHRDHSRQSRRVIQRKCHPDAFYHGHPYIRMGTAHDICILKAGSFFKTSLTMDISIYRSHYHHILSIRH